MKNKSLRKQEHLDVNYALLKSVVFYVALLALIILFGLAEDPNIYAMLG